MKLAETQRLFWELLQGTEGPLDAFVGSSALPAEERVAIYARMFLHRQVDALREMFPKVVAALGDEGFFEVAARYVHDSSDPICAISRDSSGREAKSSRPPRQRRSRRRNLLGLRRRRTPS